MIFLKEQYPQYPQRKKKEAKKKEKATTVDNSYTA